MRRRPTLSLAATLAVALSVTLVVPTQLASALADEIVVKSGKSFTGRIVREDEASYTIDTEDFGPTKITKADIVKVQRGAGPAVDPGKSPTAATASNGAPAAGQSAANRVVGTTLSETGPDGKRKPPAADEPLDAEARLAARRGMSITRVTQAPGGLSGAIVPATAEKTARAESERQAIGGAQLAAAALGTIVLVYEPARAVAFAPTGVEIGRRTVARLDTAGRGTARLTVIAGGKDETWTLRLSDVQRHVTVKMPADRVRLLEGIDTGDWLRIRTDDGAIHEGRLSELTGNRLRLVSTAPDGAAVTGDVDIATAMQVDGLTKSTSTTRMLQELAEHDPVAITMWPTGREVIGRVTEATGAAVKIDVDRDGTADEIVAFDAPVADIHRIPSKWRDIVRDLRKDSAVRVRSAEDYPDARIEREWAGMIAGITAYAICVKTPDGAAIVPFDAVLKLEYISTVHAQPARPLAKAVLNLPITPGDPRDTVASLANTKGVTALNDGSVVTHVWVTAPWDAAVAGIRIDDAIEEAVATSQLRFTTEIRPRDAKAKPPSKDGSPRDGSPNEQIGPRELVSESVDGIRVMVQADASGRVRLIEIARK